MSVETEELQEYLEKGDFVEVVESKPPEGFKFFEFDPNDGSKPVMCYTDGIQFYVEQNGHSVVFDCSIKRSVEEIVALALKELEITLGDPEAAEKIQDAIDESEGK